MGDEPEVQVGRTPEADEQARALRERFQDPARVLALSDGVFAIINTLLVLEIHVPELTPGSP
jgi:Endosomal/lysosomal potassium channel TMEM175